MPLYDYRCTACSQEVEVMHGIHDSGPETCQQCGGAMRKALSTPTIHFKGKGWAKKDAAAASAKKAKPKASSSTDAGSSTESAGADAAKSTSTADKADKGSGSPSAPESKAATTSGNTAD